MAYDLSLVHVEVTGGIATATVDNPPINLMTLELFGQLAALTEQVEQDPDVRVLVVRSADPDFFIAHFDVELILQFRRAGRSSGRPSTTRSTRCANDSGRCPRRRSA